MFKKKGKKISIFFSWIFIRSGGGQKSQFFKNGENGKFGQNRSTLEHFFSNNGFFIFLINLICHWYVLNIAHTRAFRGLFYFRSFTRGSKFWFFKKMKKYPFQSIFHKKCAAYSKNTENRHFMNRSVRKHINESKIFFWFFFRRFGRPPGGSQNGEKLEFSLFYHILGGFEHFGHFKH